MVLCADGAVYEAELLADGVWLLSRYGDGAQDALYAAVCESDDLPRVSA